VGGLVEWGCLWVCLWSFGGGGGGGGGGYHGVSVYLLT